MNWFRILGLIPLIMQVITLVESMSDGVPGKQKRDKAVDLVVGVLAQFKIPITQKFIDLITLSIDSVVGTLNEQGVFEHQPVKKAKPVKKPPKKTTKE